MSTLYTKEEQKLMIETLDAITTDLRDLYNISCQEEMSYGFKIGGDYGNDYLLSITSKNIVLYLKYSDYRMILEKNGKNKTIPRIHNYMLLSDFLTMYNQIRPGIEHKAMTQSKNKENAIKKIKKLKDMYQRDTTIEIEFNSTNNKRTIELSSEDGKKIGEIRFGNETIRIITNSEIEVVNKPQEMTKTKKRGK